MKNKATMNDVAKLAGVSQSTVSFILNDSGETISENTKKKVYDAINRLNFVPRAKIQNYTKISDNIIAILVPNVSNLFYPFLIKQVDKYAKIKGFRIIIVSTNRDKKNEQDYFKLLINIKVAGIIYTFTPSLTDINRAKAMNVPLAIIGETDEDLCIDIINLNSYMAGEIIGKHLLELNHKNVAFITSPIENVSLSRKKRLQGLTTILRGNAKLDVISATFESELDDSNYEIDIGYKETIKLMKYGSSFPTAIVGANDMISIGILKALNELNISVPNDLSVIGFDNIPMSEFLNPPLTTVEHCTDHRARLAIDLLDDKINKKNSLPVKVNYEPILIIRKSTANPKHSKMLNKK